jgi:uncharacterized membrane protein HdeD (DUF308 family)
MKSINDAIILRNHIINVLEQASLEEDNIELRKSLLFDGVARVYHGAADKTTHRWSRIFSIAAGVIEIGLSLMIMAAPVIGVELVSFLLAIALLIVGIQIIASGVSGRRTRIRA